MDNEGNIVPGAKDPELGRAECVKIYETMVRLNNMDKVFYEMQRHGRISFYMQNHGEEACTIGTAAGLQPEDMVYGQCVLGRCCWCCCGGCVCCYFVVLVVVVGGAMRGVSDVSIALPLMTGWGVCVRECACVRLHVCVRARSNNAAAAAAAAAAADDDDDEIECTDTARPARSCTAASRCSSSPTSASATSATRPAAARCRCTTAAPS
jgi:hypothetical protein